MHATQKYRYIREQLRNMIFIHTFTGCYAFYTITVVVTYLYFCKVNSQIVKPRMSSYRPSVESNKFMQFNIISNYCVCTVINKVYVLIRRIMVILL